MMQFLSDLLQAICAAALPVVAVWAVRLLRDFAERGLKRVGEASPDVAHILGEVCQTAVRAAEQIYGGGTGAEKLQYASNAAEMLLKQYGLSLDLGLIRTAIEAAVYAEFRHSAEKDQVQFLRLSEGE